MAKIVRLIQGSSEWHQHRQQHRNASETPAVLGVSPWLTPYQLWLLRTGRAEPRVNPAMLRGSQLEPLARESYERLTGLVMQPLVLVDGDYSASLDGMTLDGGLVLEIKCPVKGKESDLWQQVESGQLPEHYRLQVQHQLMVSGAKRAHVYVFDGADGVLLEHRPEPACWARIRAEWEAFMQLVETDVAPPLTERDVVLRTDNAWRAAAGSYRWAKWRADRAAVALNDARQQLIGLASHPSERGCGVLVTRYWRAGAVDYKQLPQLTDVDLEQYRGEPREELRITIVD